MQSIAGAAKPDGVVEALVGIISHAVRRRVDERILIGVRTPSHNLEPGIRIFVYRVFCRRTAVRASPARSRRRNHP